MQVDKDEIRRRAYRIWEAEGRPPGKHDEYWRRAREDIEREFQRAVGQAGDVRHRMNPPLQVEEALDPNHWRHDDDQDKGATESGKRGAP